MVNKENMKVLHVCALGATAETLLLPQIDYLRSQHLTVDIACSPDSAADRLQAQGYTVHPIQIDRKISPLLNFKTIQGLIQLMRSQAYDLVHVHTPIAAVLGRIAAKLAGVPTIVYTSHGLPFHQLTPPLQYQMYFAIEYGCAKITDLILSQNHEDIETAAQKKLCPKSKLGYLGNGVDIDRFNRSVLDSDHQSHLRDELGIPASAKLIVGTVGRLTRTKGSGYLIEAAAQLVEEFPQLHILVVGGELKSDPEPYYHQLTEKIEQLNLKSHVTFTGDRTDIPQMLGLMDIFVLATFAHEGLPRSILEAMAMGVPVVTTDIRGCREAVLPGQTGSIVPSQTITPLAKALRPLLADSDLRTAYGAAGRQRVETEYDENVVFKRLFSFYQDLGMASAT